MASRVLDIRTVKPLQPATSLWKQYDPAAAPRAFRADTAAAARRWQRTTRRALGRLLRLEEGDATPPAPRRIEVVDKGGLPAGEDPPAHRPRFADAGVPSAAKGAGGPLPSVVAFHGHGLRSEGHRRPVGGTAASGTFPTGITRTSASPCAAPDSPWPHPKSPASASARPTSPTSTPAGIPVDLCPHGLSRLPSRNLRGRHPRCATAFASSTTSRPAPSSTPGRLGAMGISGGGMHTFFSTCIDERIRACVVSGYYSTFRDSVLAMHHCPCNYVPGLSEFGRDARPGRPRRPAGRCWWKPAPTTRSSRSRRCAPAWRRRAGCTGSSMPPAG